MNQTEIIQLVSQQQTINYVQVSSAAIWIFEWLVLLPDEVSLVWGSQWSFMTFLYIWTRYSPIADTILGVLSSVQPMSPTECHLSDAVNSFLIGVGIYTSELVLLWRTFAIWGDSKWIKRSLGCLWLLMVPCDLYFISSFVSSTVYAPQPLPGLPGCNLVHASAVDAGDFISLVILESIIVVLTITKGVQNAQSIRYGSLMPVLYRDGVLFFICLLSVSVACILAPVLGPRIYAIMLSPFLRVMHSILCCRVILHIRSAASVNTQDTTSPVLATSIAFNTPGCTDTSGTTLSSLAVAAETRSGSRTDLETGSRGNSSQQESDVWWRE